MQSTTTRGDPAAGKPVTPAAPAPPLPVGVQPVIGETGQPCTAACAASGMQCAPDGFPALNHCNVVREHFNCEAGCEADNDPDMPSYVVDSAPKIQRPTMCLVHDGSGEATTCEGSHLNSQRLCPCAPSPTEDEALAISNGTNLGPP